MAYSKEIYEKALDEIKRRKTNAEMTAEQHKSELCIKYPEFQFIESELAKTGYEIIGAFSMPAQKAEKRLDEIRKKNSELRKERQNLLKQLGLPADYLDIKYTCNKCEDTGFFEERDEKSGISHGTHLCSCHIDLLKKLSVEQMAKDTPLELSSFDDFDLNYYKKSRDGAANYKIMKDVYGRCVKYAANFDLDSVSLYFYGRTGLGKTHLSLSIANEVIKKGYNVIYGSVINFLNKIEKEKFGRGETFDTENLLIDADLLILDDLGAEFSTSFTLSVLYNIINSRICRGVPTIISSNLDLAELKSRYPESVASRIIGTYAVVNFRGDDIRQIMNNE